MSQDIIPVSEPIIGEEEKRLVLDCLETGWISSEGAYVRQFEELCAESCGTRHGIAVNSGTAALQIAVAALELQEGDEVILPSFTIISCAQAITEAGAVPVLVDSDSETWTMDIAQVEARITPRTRAIMAVHIYGHPADMDPLLALAEKHDLKIIEDIAEAHGAEYRGKPCGSMSHIAAVSFYANKLVTTGEGGMVLTDDDQLAEHARSLRNMCFIPERRFLHNRIGHNYRMTNVQAAMGVGQIGNLDKFVERKRVMAERYNKGLAGLPIQLPVEKDWAKNIYWMYALVLNDDVPLDAPEASRRMGAEGIQTRPFFLGMHEQPVFHEMGLFRGEQYPVCERISRKGFYLPSGQAITDEQIDRTCETLRAILTAL